MQQFSKNSLSRIKQTVNKVLGAPNQKPTSTVPQAKNFAYSPFIVKLVTDGGSAGSVSTTCSFTYEAFIYNTSTSLGAGLVPANHSIRMTNVPYAAATIGLGFYNETADLQIIVLDEQSLVEDPC